MPEEKEKPGYFSQVGAAFKDRTLDKANAGIKVGNAIGEIAGKVGGAIKEYPKKLGEAVKTQADAEIEANKKIGNALTGWMKPSPNEVPTNMKIKKFEE